VYLLYSVIFRAVESRYVSRLETVSRHYFAKSRSRLGLVGLKSRSRLGTFKSRKMGNGHVSAVYFISPLELFQHHIFRKNPISRLPYNVHCTIIDFKTHNGSKVTNEYINEVLIPSSAEEQ